MITVPYYGPVVDYKIEEFINKLEEVKQSGETDLFVKVSSGGGNPFAGYGMITAMRDFLSEVEGGTLKYRAEGVAASMMAFISLYVTGSEAIEQTHFMVHRAAIPRWMEDEESLQMLEKVNNDLMKAFKKKVNVQKFQALPKMKGISIKRFFDSRQERIDVNLTAKEAKDVGLIDNVISLSPVEAKELNSSLIAASMDPLEFEEPKAESEEKIPEKTDTNMTLDEFKAKHPGLYQQVFAAGRAEGVTEGTENERDRVEAWMAFNEIDAEAVKVGIESGKGLTQKATAHFTAVGISNGFVQASADAGKGVNTKGKGKPDNLGGDPNKGGATPGEPSAEDEALDNFDAALKAKLGLKVEEPQTEE